MAQIKTAISLKASLLEQADALAQELEVSRSRLFALAVEAFIQSRQNQKMLENLNNAYDDAPDPVEREQLQRMRRKQRHLLKGQW